MADETLAVLTGDIVKSARLPADMLDEVLERLAEAADIACAWSDRKGGALFTRFRGDGWQCLAPSPELCLRTALFLRAHVRSLGRGYDTRISVGIGSGTLPSADSLASAGGTAFEASGAGLDRMGRASRLAIAWDSPAPCASSIAAVFALADEVSRRWTPRQAEVFMRSLRPHALSQEKIAGDLGVTQQMVAKHLGAGGDWALGRGFDAMEDGD